MTLLFTFIKEKIRDYREPTRKGTPKGEPIGFSKKKYALALIGISNAPLKISATLSLVDYQVLRKWNTEKDFQALKRQMALECAEFISKTVMNNIRKCKTPIDWQRLVFSQLKDMDLYGEDLFRHLKNKLSDLIQEETKMKYDLIRKKDILINNLSPLNLDENEVSTDLIKIRDIKYVRDYNIINLFIDLLNWVFEGKKGSDRNFRLLWEEVDLILEDIVLLPKIISKKWGNEMEEELTYHIIREFNRHEEWVVWLTKERVKKTRDRVSSLNPYDFLYDIF
jgi:hypothetical protein